MLTQVREFRFFEFMIFCAVFCHAAVDGATCTNIRHEGVTYRSRIADMGVATQVKNEDFDQQQIMVTSVFIPSLFLSLSLFPFSPCLSLFRQSPVSAAAAG